MQAIGCVSQVVNSAIVNTLMNKQGSLPVKFSLQKHKERGHGSGCSLLTPVLGNYGCSSKQFACTLHLHLFRVNTAEMKGFEWSSMTVKIWSFQI